MTSCREMADCECLLGTGPGVWVGYREVMFPNDFGKPFWLTGNIEALDKRDVGWSSWHSLMQAVVGPYGCRWDAMLDWPLAGAAWMLDKGRGCLPIRWRLPWGSWLKAHRGKKDYGIKTKIDTHFLLISYWIWVGGSLGSALVPVCSAHLLPTPSSTEDSSISHLLTPALNLMILIFLLPLQYHTCSLSHTCAHAAPCFL